LGVIFTGMCLGLSGCTTYYKVTDPTTGKVYYTTDIRKKGDGAVQLTDSRTGNQVTIQNSEVQEVKKEVYETARIEETLNK